MTIHEAGQATAQANYPLGSPRSILVCPVVARPAPHFLPRCGPRGRHAELANNQ